MIQFKLIKIPAKTELILNSIHSNKSILINITDLEQHIDNLVYKLYELTYDAVLVVEPEFGERMSREEYEGLKVG